MAKYSTVGQRYHGPSDETKRARIRQSHHRQADAIWRKSGGNKYAKVGRKKDRKRVRK
jgi:hypothetical protein